MDDYLYQKDLHLPLKGKKPTNLNDDKWVLLGKDMHGII